MTRRLLGLSLAGVLLFATVGSAQQIGRDEYQSHLPVMPPRVGQTAASVQFSLYGDVADPLYRDAFPVDGIDDARARQLLRLSARFSPVLRRNNFSAPMDYRVAMRGRPVLQVDTWSVGSRVASDSVLLYQPVPPATELTPGGAYAGESPDPEWTEELREWSRSDAVLAALLAELHPDVGEARVVSAERPREKSLFFDFPGEDERSWREAYRDQRDSRIYAHFFINEDRDTELPHRYDFVIQYWFFYPFNDGPNNHEGDWEHIAVLVTTPERAAATGPGAGRLDEHAVRRILAGAAPVDSLVIHAVEYYFHESVITLDYLAAATATQHTHWQELGHLHIWEQPDFITQTVLKRVRAHGGRLATHPVAYIGGNAKGPDELLAVRPRFGGSYNRNPHGTYPFPGTWQSVGALGSTERVAGELVPRLRPELDPAARDAPLAFEDEHVLSYSEGDILLMPDWERLKDIALANTEARREWSWLLLPIRWGYPATSSPGAGAVKHVDLGHLAPVGPMHQATWNRLAPATGRHQFTPRVLRVMTAPTTPWDMIQSGWGVLNVPRMLLGFLPGVSVIASQLSPWLSLPLVPLGAETARTFAPERRPHRFTSSSFGRQWQSGGGSFAELLPAPDDARMPSRGDPGPLEVETDRAQLNRGASEGLRASISLFYGPKLSVHNAYTRSLTQVSYQRMEGGAAAGPPVRGQLKLQEFLGGFRYRVRELNEYAQLFAGGGWGWTWYRVDQVTVGDVPVDYTRSGGYPIDFWPPAKWWPNTGYLTAGVELTAPRSAWAFNRVGYGLEFQYTGLLHRLGPTDPREGSMGPATRRELSVGIVASW